MTRDDATTVVTRMAKYKTFFLNIMMTEELCLPVPAPALRPAPRRSQAGLASHAARDALRGRTL